mmetsp:Transcript_117715/g.293498  ORF Transcript_117715/g.293498 Transcript_117715/m.293498 type:complete len:1229 (-) Transcript_117715:61-3747(-)
MAAEDGAAADVAMNGEPQPAEAEAKPKKQRGKPKDDQAPPKPKNPYQKVTSEARQRLKAERPELANDLKAMGLALKEEWDKVPELNKEQMQKEYEAEMEIWRPKWAAYKQTDHYKEFFEVKQDWIDGRVRKKLIKRHSKDAPKRPKSAYMIFAGEIRERVVKEVSEAGGGMGDIGKKIAEEWAALSEAKKGDYAETSAKMKESFDVEYKEYRKTDKFREFMDAKAKLEGTQQRKKLVRTKFADAPKKPPSAFGLFRSDVMPTVQEDCKGMGPADLGKKIASMWAEATEQRKASYQEQAAKLKNDYGVQLAAFKKNNTYTTFLEQRYKLKSRENKLVNLREMPKKPKSVFALFKEQHQSEATSKVDLKQKFAAVSDDEKARLEAKEKELKEKWEEDVKAWKESERFKEYEKNEKKAKQELMTQAMKVMTMKFLHAAPPQPPKSPFSVFVHEKRKATGDIEGEKKNKQAKQEEVKTFQKEWEKLDQQAKSTYETAFKEKIKTWQEDVKAFMAQDSWKEYVAEAKRLKVPIKNFLTQKTKALKQLGTGTSSSSMPAKPSGMPSKPPDAFKLFLKEKKGEIDQVEQITGMWQQLDEEGKRKYNEEADSLRKEYDEAMDKFKQSDEGKKYFKDVNQVLRRKRVSGARQKYLKDMPKPPPGAVKAYIEKTSAEIKKQSPDLKTFEIKKQAKERWLALDASERQVFEDAAKAKYAEYEVALADFKKGDDYRKFARVLKPMGKRLAGKGKGKGKAKAKAKAGPAAPPKPQGMPKKPKSAFMVFCKEMTGSGKSLADMAQAFKNLSDEDKNERKKRAEEAEEKYKQDLAEFKQTAEGKKYGREVKVFQKRLRIGEAKTKFLKDAPKKPPAAYSFFVAEKRDEVQKQNPDLKGLGPIMGKLGEMWKSLTEEERSPWMEKEKEKLAAFEKAMEEYRQGANYKSYAKVVGRFMRKPKRKAKAKAKSKATGKGKAKAKAKAKAAQPEKPDNMPKKPLNAMTLFMKDKGLNLKTMGAAWAELGAEGQKKYNEEAKQKTAEYEKAMKEFSKTAEGKKYNRLKAAADKKDREKKAKERFLGGESAPKEPKRPPSAYFIFVSEKREVVAKEFPGKVGEVARKLTELWGNLEASEKKGFEDKAEELKKEYDKQMQAYRESEGFKRYDKALKAIKGGPKKPKSKAKAKPKAAPSGGRGRGRGGGGKGTGRGQGGAAGTGAAAAGVASDSDVMGSDSSSSDSDDSDSD